MTSPRGEITCDFRRPAGYINGLLFSLLGFVEDRGCGEWGFGMEGKRENGEGMVVEWALGNGMEWDGVGEEKLRARHAMVCCGALGLAQISRCLV